MNNEKHRASIAAAKKRYRSSEKGKAARRRHYQKHREKILQKRREMTPEQRKRKAEYDHRRWVSQPDELRRKRLDQAKAYNKSPEGKARRNARNADPERREKVRQYWAKYTVTPKARIAAYKKHLRLKFGFSKTQIEEILKRSSTCEICNDPPSGKRRHHVDHCHASGKFRGILCAHCNKMLSGARDNIAILIKAIEYLKRHGPSVGGAVGA